MNDYELGLFLGLVIGEGSFTGDRKQPELVIRMHTRHEKLLKRVHQWIPDSTLHGPYEHTGKDGTVRRSMAVMIRGKSLKWAEEHILRSHLTKDLCPHVYARYQKIKKDYPLAFVIDDDMRAIIDR